jgi:uncharacterized membrane protein (UPF0127 family)
LKLRRFSVVAVSLLFASACASAPRTAAPTPTTTPASSPLPSNPPLDTVEVAFGPRAVVAEVADEHEERILGLMHRPTLGDDAGMLFVFPAKSSGGFWMKNTLIPLSIAYMGRTDDDSFEVLAILDMEPCTADPCPSYPPGLTYDATLEVNQGWFDDAGVAAGDEARLDRLVVAE